MDGGVAAPALTFRFGIPIFTLRVFSTNESLSTEVVTCGGTETASNVCSFKTGSVHVAQRSKQNRQRSKPNRQRSKLNRQRSKLNRQRSKLNRRAAAAHKLWRCSSVLMAAARWRPTILCCDCRLVFNHCQIGSRFKKASQTFQGHLCSDGPAPPS